MKQIYTPQQIIGQISNQPTQLVYTKPKPVFVMRFRSGVSDAEFENVKQAVWKSDMPNEYHLIMIRNDKDKDEFEMYNADKIERQDWNELVNKITK